MFHLTFPNTSHKEKYLAMIKEWWEFEPIPTSPRRLFVWESYQEFLDIITTDLTESTRWVNSTLFFFMDDEEILGAIQIRHHIDHPNLKESGGHIGYWLCPNSRGKWLAKEMLKLALIEARKLWLTEIMISADEDNPASWKTIESCGGIFSKSILKDEKLLKIYKIHLL